MTAASRYLKKTLNEELKYLGKYIVFGGIGLAAGFYIDTNYGGFRTVVGPSMSPALNQVIKDVGKFDETSQIFHGSQDKIIFTRKVEELERGDIVILNDPKSPLSTLVKRVVAIGGDTVVPLKPGGNKCDPLKLAQDQVWIESDAGPGYKDSNLFGTVPLAAIGGIVKYRFNIQKFEFETVEREMPDHVKPRITISPSE